MQNVRMMLAGLLALVRGVTVQGKVADVTADRFTWRMDIGIEVPPWLQISLDDKAPTSALKTTPAPELHTEPPAAELLAEVLSETPYFDGQMYFPR